VRPRRRPSYRVYAAIYETRVPPELRGRAWLLPIAAPDRFTAVLVVGQPHVRTCNLVGMGRDSTPLKVGTSTNSRVLKTPVILISARCH
jgi:hypothetical protein